MSVHFKCILSCLFRVLKTTTTPNPKHTHLAAHLHLKVLAYLLRKGLLPWLLQLQPLQKSADTSRDCLAETQPVSFVTKPLQWVSLSQLREKYILSRSLLNSLPQLLIPVPQELGLSPSCGSASGQDGARGNRNI